jgi:hypothetical protein
MYSALIEDGVVNFAAHEILYILATVDDAASAAAAERLDLPAPEDRSTMLAAGLTSLYARGMVEVSDDEVKLSEAAAIAGFVMTDSEVWVELAFITDEAVDAGWLVRRGDAAILLTPRRLGTFELRVLDPRLDGKWLADIAFAFLEGRTPSAFFATRRSVDGESGLAVRHLEQGGLQLSDPSGHVLASESADGSRSELERLMSDFMA